MLASIKIFTIFVKELNETVKSNIMENYTITDTNKLKATRFTYSEFVDYAINRKKHANCSNESSKKGSKSFTQTESMEEAIELARGGYDAGIKQLDLEGGILADTGIEFSPSVQGSVVNMQNYLLGMPDNMFEMKETREYNMPMLTIYVNLTYTAAVSGREAMKYAKRVTEYVNKFQSSHNIKLVGLFASKQKKDYVVEVLIKDFDERFVLNNVAFAFHPSMFRRLWFSHVESESFWDWGYGSTMGEDKIFKYCKAHLDGGKGIMLPSLQEHGADFSDKHLKTI